MRMALLVLVLFSAGCSTEPQQTKEFTVKVLSVERVDKPNGDSLIKSTVVEDKFFHPITYRLTLLCGGEDSAVLRTHRRSRLVASTKQKCIALSDQLIRRW